MKFSVLIAHYNNAEYFKDCYESLLKQTYKNWEAVILDDGSNPEEKESVKKIIAEDHRFKYFENEINSGVGITKARLIELATGEICGFIDPDDAIVPTAIEKMVDAYNKNKYVALYSTFTFCDEKLTKKSTFKNSAQVKNANPLFFNIFFEVNHFFTFKKSAYQQTSGIASTLSSSVDQDLYLKLYDVGNFKFINEPLYLYRQHSEGVSQSPEKKEKLYKNWHHVLYEVAKRRNISKLYRKNIQEIDNLPKFLFKHQNSLIQKFLRRLK
ncbi:glycosyltransferase family 2 protein [Kaistella haifensis]|nr:glycosyltransferase family 2 protein [Kaistella haifensis]